MQNPQRFDNLLAKFAGQGREATARSKVHGTMYWSNHKNAHCMQLRNVQRDYHVRQAGQLLAHDISGVSTAGSSRAQALPFQLGALPCKISIYVLENGITV